VCDINLYLPSHHAENSQGWTGIPGNDVTGNRMKRFFHDKWSSTEGVRVGMGPEASTLPDRSTREQFIQAGCEMQERPGSTDVFNVKLAVRDASTVVVALHVPIFVRGQRWGAVAVGWVVTDSITGAGQ